MFDVFFMLVGGIQCLFFAVLLFNKPDKKLPDYLLCTYLLLVCIHLGYYYFVFSNPEAIPSGLGVLGFSLVILYSPIYFLYIKTLAFNESWHQKMLMHLLPYVLYNIILFAHIQISDLTVRPQTGFLVGNKSSIILAYSGIMLAIISLGYLIWGITIFLKYRRHLKTNISNIEPGYYRWIQYLLIAYFILLFTIYGVIEFHDILGISSAHIFKYVTLLIISWVFVLGFLALQQKSFYRRTEKYILPENKDSLKTGKYQRSGLSSDQIENLANRLQVSFDENEWYTEENISLGELAKRLNTSPPYLSQVINQKFQMNFYDLINSRRIESVKSKMKNPSFSHLSILGIAQESGFKSKSAFNKAFKKFVGTTPSTFRKSVT